MEPKPRHLSTAYAEQFQDQSIAAAYTQRPPYSEQAIKVLAALCMDQPRTILDIGCGTGDIACRLVTEVERIDAVDFSAAMITRGKERAQGNHPNLNWITGRVEDVALQPPYALITAGESLHWMDWEIVLPLFSKMLTRRGQLAIIERQVEPNPWDHALQAILQRYSTNQEYRPYNLVEELKQRHLFQQRGEILAHPVPFVQSAAAYIQAFHSMNGFSQERMGSAAAQAFDHELQQSISPYLQDGQITTAVLCQIIWGKPLPGTGH